MEKNTHTQVETHAPYDSSERVISLSQNPTQQTQQTNIHVLNGIRTEEPIKKAATDLRLDSTGTGRDLSTRMIIYTSIYIYICTCVYVYIYAYTYIYTYIHTRKHSHRHNVVQLKSLIQHTET
jgi:hypothetical protein